MGIRIGLRHKVESEQTNLKSQLKKEWAELADYWIEHIVEGESVHRVGLLDPWMLDAVGDVSGLRVIDLGCGEGRFSRMLAERGAIVTGIDFCEQFVAYASAHKLNNELYVLSDMTDLGEFDNESFDLAVSYITLVDVPDFRAAIREAHRVLRQDGRFVICNLQSMITAGNGWVKHQNNKLHYKLDDYFDEGTRELSTPNYFLTNFHRTLSTYVNTFLEEGFVLEGLREPTPSPEQVNKYPAIADNLRVAEFIIYLLRKRSR